MSVCTRCKSQSNFFDQLKEYLVEMGYTLRMLTSDGEWCAACFEQRYHEDEDIRIRLTFRYCSCDNANLPRVPRLDDKFKVKIEVDEISTEHGYSNAFTVEQDIKKIEWILKKEANRALKMFDGSDKEWREMLHEMRDWP